MKRILVTGGAGFIGSHTCLTLLEAGFDLFVIDSLINSSRIAIDRVLDIYKEACPESSNSIYFFKADILNLDSLNNIFSSSTQDGNPISAVIHFAGLKSVKESSLAPLNYWSANVAGTINLLNSMLINNCFNIIFSSSATVYGNPIEVPITEKELINPINPYGNSKATIELILSDLFHSSPDCWRIANLRYFNPIGAHPSGRIGENPKNIPNNIFPIITKVALGLLDKLEIYGNDWPTKDGTGVRDYIHVMDLAEGHKVAVEYLLSEKPQLLNVNLGTGKGVSVLELISTFERVNNCNVPYVFTTRRTGDIAISLADNQLAKDKLNWAPIRSLDQMCRDGWNWQKANMNGYS